MTSLYETAINGMGLGTKDADIDQMYADYKKAGNEIVTALLLDISMGLEDIKRAERAQAGAAQSMRTALERFEANPTVNNAEWLTTYATAAERSAREAQAAYTAVGKAWRLFTMATK